MSNGQRSRSPREGKNGGAHRGDQPPTGTIQLPQIIWRGESGDPIESARKWAKRWKDDKLTSAQLRRYFSEVKRLQLSINQEGWDKHALEVKLLKAKAAYALRQDSERSKRQSMVDFIQNCVDRVKNKDDFEYFVNYFEAAVGFAYGFGLSDRER